MYTKLVTVLLRCMLYSDIHWRLHKYIYNIYNFYIYTCDMIISKLYTDSVVTRKSTFISSWKFPPFRKSHVFSKAFDHGAVETDHPEVEAPPLWTFSQKGVSINGGFPQQPLVFLLKMIILGWRLGGTTIFGNTQKKIDGFWVSLYRWVGNCRHGFFAITKCRSTASTDGNKDLQWFVVCQNGW